jgi:hypothetical protein
MSVQARPARARRRSALDTAFVTALVVFHPATDRDFPPCLACGSPRSRFQVPTHDTCRRRLRRRRVRASYRSAAPPASTNDTVATIPADQGSPRARHSTASNKPGEGPPGSSLRLEPVRGPLSNRSTRLNGRASTPPGPDETKLGVRREDRGTAGRMGAAAYRRVAANKGAPGADEQTLGEFEAGLRDNLYKISNRMSSGSYFPPPVEAVEIPKPHGGGGPCAQRAPQSQTGLPKRWWPCTWRNEPNLGSTRAPMATGRASRPWTLWQCAGSGAGSSTG